MEEFKQEVAKSNVLRNKSNLLISGYVRSEKGQFPSDVLGVITSYFPLNPRQWISRLIGHCSYWWECEVGSNVEPGQFFVHNLKSPIIALEFVRCAGNMRKPVRFPHIIITGVQTEADSEMQSLSIPPSRKFDQVERINFGGFITKCGADYGFYMNTVKGFEFISRDPTIGCDRYHQIGSVNVEYSYRRKADMFCPSVSPPHEADSRYVLSGFYGRAGWYINKIGFIFTDIS